MAISRRYKKYEIDQNSSQYVFSLRESGQINEAHNLAIKLFKQDPEDEWIHRAYAWVLIDIIKNEVKVNSGKATYFFNQLLSIGDRGNDAILRQINFLRPKLNPVYQEIQDAENLSKKGNHKQAIEQFIRLQNQGKLLAEHHESYGWAIYRCIKQNKDSFTVKTLKGLLFEYLKLKNPRFR